MIGEQYHANINKTSKWSIQNDTSATPIKIIFSLLKSGKLKASWKKAKGKLKASERQAKSELKGS